MKKKANLNKNKKIVISMLIVLTILIVILIVLINILRTPQETFEYIYSDEMDKGTFSPEMIHIVIAAYEGEVNPKAISKSTYYLITEIIPEYLNKCKDGDTNKYFDKESNSIYLMTGIKNKEDFKKFMDELKKLNGNLKFEYAKFDRESVKVNENDLEVVLKIKYQNQEEISVNMRIKNTESETRPSIEFYK